MDMSADGVVLPFMHLRSGMVVVSILNPSWWPDSLIQSDLLFGLDHSIRGSSICPIRCFETDNFMPRDGFPHQLGCSHLLIPFGRLSKSVPHFLQVDGNKSKFKLGSISSDSASSLGVQLFRARQYAQIRSTGIDEGFTRLLGYALCSAYVLKFMSQER